MVTKSVRWTSTINSQVSPESRDVRHAWALGAGGHRRRPAPGLTKRLSLIE
jgi:hypothetical protein